ncbi:hypothetical protein GJ496_008818 [Pomphorhynchus laevis]|nr:hypothetical protein GJ496_008818 [Pomphorhynchus laevis]
MSQCLGPNCTKAANLDSKYCSTECGLNMARQRIFNLNTDTIQQWTTVLSESDNHDQQMLNHIDIQTQRAMDELGKANQMQKTLDNILEKAAQLTPVDLDHATEDSNIQIEEEGYTSCIICGLDVSVKTFLRHIERCFSKHECQSTFGSNSPSKMPGIFCDVHDHSTGIYCKRLRSMCPEHSSNDYVSIFI